jgi:raffinose/stachyose/melibiose transport system substrate-binding protein
MNDLAHARSGPGRRLAGLAVAVVLLAVACSPPGASTAPSSAAASAAPSTSAAPSQAEASASAAPSLTTEPVTLKMLDYQASANAALGTAIDNLINGFTTAHPNVTIKREATDFATLLTKQQLLMSGPNPCDICDLAVNYTAAGKLASAGLLANLDPYAAQYGWAARYSPFLYGQSKYGPPLETGPVYGIFITEDIVGAFYNKNKLAALGLAVPTTFDEFEAALVKAKAAGELPIKFGNLDKYPAIHVYQQIQNRYCQKDYLRNYSYRLAPAAFDVDCNLQAATKFTDWIKAGYFGKSDPNALGLDDARNAFIKGSGVFFFDGTWDTKSIDTGLGAKVGFFNVPPPADGSNGLVVLGGLGQTFAVHGKSKNPDVAAAFLDYLASDTAASAYLAAGAVPGFHFTTTETFSSVREDVLKAIDTANTGDALVGYLDGPTPRMYDVLSAALQDLISGKTTPAQFLAVVQADYAKGP